MRNPSKRKNQRFEDEELATDLLDAPMLGEKDNLFRLQCCFPQEDDTNLLVMLRVFGTVGAVIDVLHGRRRPSEQESHRMNEAFRLARQHHWDALQVQTATAHQAEKMLAVSQARAARAQQLCARMETLLGAPEQSRESQKGGGGSDLFSIDHHHVGEGE